MAGLHTAVMSLLRHLHIHSSLLPSIESVTDTTLGTHSQSFRLIHSMIVIVWTEGIEDVPDDYEDVKNIVMSRVFAAPVVILLPFDFSPQPLLLV